MVVKVSGKIDGKEVIFERAEGDRWNATVPYDLDGMYVVELTAENDAGNIAYCKKMLLIVDPATLCVRLVPLDYMVEIVPEDCKVTVIPKDYAVEAVPEQYLDCKIAPKEKGTHILEVTYTVADSIRKARIEVEVV